MLRRLGLAVRRVRIARATFEDESPYRTTNVRNALTQEELEEELGYNKKYLDYTDECLFSFCINRLSVIF